jgi:hypothetical protein
MKPLSESLVDETWQEIDRYTDQRANREMMQFGKDQSNLLAFFLEFTQDLDEEAEELGVYLLFVVYRMFLKGYGKKIRKITQKELAECYEKNGNAMESLGSAHEKFIERFAQTQMTGQPHVLRYVAEALLESLENDDDDDDFEPLNDEDIGALFLLLKTAVDCLNSKTDS